MLKDKLVLLVDDEPAILSATRAGLAGPGLHRAGRRRCGRCHQAHPIAETQYRRLRSGHARNERLRVVRGGEKTKEFAKLPFVFLTSVDDYYAKKFGKEIGGAAYVTKPVDLDELETNHQGQDRRVAAHLHSCGRPIRFRQP